MNTATLSIPRLIFLQGRKIFVVQPDQIIRLEARSNYTQVFFTDHPPLLMAKVLGSYAEILRPYGFIRTHRSHLINMLYVSELDLNGVIHMTDSSIAEISRRKKREVCKSITQS